MHILCLHQMVVLTMHPVTGGHIMARNKTVNFPEKKPNGEPQAKAEYASKRANGTINTRPQERMRHSSKRNDI